MKLYYKPGSCSLAAHIALRAAGADFNIEKVDTDTKQTETGEDYLAITTKGYVPALRLDDGGVVTESAAVLQYIADKFPDANLAPQAGTIERVRVQEHLNFVASELHKAFSPLFKSPDETARKAAKERVSKHLSQFEAILADGRSYVCGETFTVADAYFFVVTNWSNFVGIKLDQWPRIAAYMRRLAVLPAVREAMQAEGLLN